MKTFILIIMLMMYLNTIAQSVIIQDKQEIQKLKLNKKLNKNERDKEMG